MTPNTIRQLREAAALTQAEIAERAGVCEDTVNRIERGLQARPETIALLRNALVSALRDRHAMLVQADRLLQSA